MQKHSNIDMKIFVQYNRYMPIDSNIDLDLTSLRALLEVVHHVAAILEQFLLAGVDVLVGSTRSVDC